MTTMTLCFEAIPELLGVSADWTEKGGAFWLETGALPVRDLARAMNECGARFITITASQLPESQVIRLEYHWDLDGRILGFTFLVGSRSIDSILDLCPAADWIEREIYEYFKVEFKGRALDPLFLREGDKPGVNLREEEE